LQGRRRTCASVSSVTLNGAKVEYETRLTNRVKEILVEAPTTGEQELVVRTASG
jgi:hypothetical protein